MSGSFDVVFRDDWKPWETALKGLCSEIQNTGGDHDAIKTVKWGDHVDRDHPELLSDAELQVTILGFIMVDLAWHGWRFSFQQKGIQFDRPNADIHASDKAVLKQLHEKDRDRQLQEPAVSKFIASLEVSRLTSSGRFSIFSLMRSGVELAEKLRRIQPEKDKETRFDLLCETISPYIQIVEKGNRCQFTGLDLQDVWRYFRHTWTTAYKSIPGRSINILIRDAAVPNHPVIGIAALGSSIVQQSTRDQWIGWDQQTVLQRLQADCRPKDVNWIATVLEERMSSIFLDDFFDEGILSAIDLRYPRMSVVDRLERVSNEEREKHHNAPIRPLKGKLKTDWATQAKTPLYRFKRATVLAGLLKAKHVIQSKKLLTVRGPDLRSALEDPAVTQALASVLRSIKSDNVGVHMMDITICGAIEPYRAILGGKLVCMLLASPEISRFYNTRYSDQVSVIASSMKGSSVIKKPQLVLLSTTSLYGSGSSQYNRISIPGKILGVNEKNVLQYVRLGKSEGFGTFHFGRVTTRLMDHLQTRTKNVTSINNIFGEGVNPLMRKIRQALYTLGISAEAVLKHKNERILYGVPLAMNFREVLLGRQKRGRYLIPQTRPVGRTKAIAEYWVTRWLDNRIQSNEVLEKVAEHDFVHPIDHGARPVLYRLERDDQRNLDIWG